MKPHTALLLMTTAALGPLACFADGNATTVLAEQALRVKLERTYPGVARWDIELLPISGAEKSGAVSDPSIVVTRTGARSAVWVGSPATALHRSGRLLWFSVAGYAPTVVAARAIAAAASLDFNDATIMERDVVGADCELLRDPSMLAGMRSKRMLRAGEVICAGLLEAIPPVSRGEEVTLRYLGQGFILTARGVAQGDGLLGKPVTVRNLSSGDVFTATVSGQGEVSVHE